MYGDNEDLLGRWFAANPTKRPQIFLATKFANRVKDDGSRLIDSSSAWCREAVDKSLKRLGLSSIDLYYCHRLDGKTPVEETVQEMVRAKEAGKIRYLGLSECSSDSLRRACKVHHISAVQVEYSPFALDIESEKIGLLKTARELGVAVVAYSPVGRGMVTGAIKSRADLKEGDFRLMAPRFSEENFPKNLELAETIGKLAQKKGATATQLTLAWLMAQGDDVSLMRLTYLTDLKRLGHLDRMADVLTQIFPIPGTTKIERLDENLGAMKIQLSSSEEKEIRQACENAEVHGSRYPEAMAAALFADTPPMKA